MKIKPSPGFPSQSQKRMKLSSSRPLKPRAFKNNKAWLILYTKQFLHMHKIKLKNHDDKEHKNGINIMKEIYLSFSLPDRTKTCVSCREKAFDEERQGQWNENLLKRIKI